MPIRMSIGAGLVGRLHLDGLEPPLERPVLLDVLPVLRGRGRADAADLAPRQGRLQDVGGVERPFRRAGAHQRVQLVDEHDDVLVLDQLLHDGFEPLFELPPVLRARHHERDVERDDALVGEVARHASGDDPLGQPFDNRGLADAGLADEDRVVLRPPAEHLLDALHLVLAADQRVERLPRGGLGQVAAELGEQRRVLGPGRRGGLLVEQRHHVLADRIQPQPFPDQDGRRQRALLAQEAEQQVLGADVGVQEPVGLLGGGLQGALGLRAEGDVDRRRHPLAEHAAALDLFPDRIEHDLRAGENPAREALPLPDEPEQEVFGLDGHASELAGLVPGEEQDPAGPFRITFEHQATRGSRRRQAVAEVLGFNYTAKAGPGARSTRARARRRPGAGRGRTRPRAAGCAWR